MFKLHLKTQVKDVLTDLTMIKEQVKTHPKPSNSDNKSSISRIHVAFMGLTNGMIAVRIPNIIKVMEKKNQVVRIKMTMDALVKIDAPKPMDIKLLAVEAIAEPENLTVIMSIIASIIKMQATSLIHQVLKY